MRLLQSIKNHRTTYTIPPIKINLFDLDRPRSQWSHFYTCPKIYTYKMWRHWALEQKHFCPQQGCIRRSGRRIRGKTMCLPSLKGRHNKQVQAHQVHSSVLIKSYYWTGIFINILDDLLKDSLLFIRLIIDIIFIRLIIDIICITVEFANTSNFLSDIGLTECKFVPVPQKSWWSYNLWNF